MNLKHLILITVYFILPFLAFSQNFDVTITTKNAECSSDGEVTINVTGGTSPICYDISSCPNCYTCLNQNSYTFKGLPPGNHTITITDNSSPQKKLTKVITISGSYNLPTVISKSDKSMVTAIASSGKRPYLYSISTDNGLTFSNPQTDSTFQNICGKYCVRVIDNCGNFTSYCSEIYNILKITSSCKELNGNYLVSIDTLSGYAGSGTYRNLKLSNGKDSITINNPELKKDYSIKVGCNWKITLEDYCGNIVTKSIDCNVLSFEFVCVNTKDSTVSIKILSGTPPFKRYMYVNDTSNIKENNSDNFTKVPFAVGKNITIRVRDNCGNVIDKLVNFVSYSMAITCPDSAIYLTTSSPHQVDVSCTSCNPVQNYKLVNYGSIIIKNYTFPLKLTTIDTCNEINHLTLTKDPQLELTIGCGRVEGTVTMNLISDNKFTPLIALVSQTTYKIYDTLNVLVATNNTGLFKDLKVGNYFFVAECPFFGKIQKAFSLKPRPLDFRAGITTKKLKSGACQKVYNIKTVGSSRLNIHNITENTIDTMKGTLLPNGTFIGNAYLDPLIKYRLFSYDGCLDTTFILPSIPAQTIDWIRPKCPSEGDLQLTGALPLTWWYDWGKLNAPVIIQNNDNGFYSFDCVYDIFSNPPCNANYDGKFYGLVPGSKHKAYLFVNSETGSLAKTNYYGPLCPIDSIEFIFKPANYKAPDSISVNYFNCSGQNGTLFLDVKNGESPFKFKIIDCNTKNVIQEKTDSSNQVIFNNIANGVYCFLVEDKCGNTIDSKKDQLLAPEFLTKIENINCVENKVKLSTSKFNGAIYTWSDFKTKQVIYSGNGFSELETIISDSAYILLEIKFNNCVIHLDTIFAKSPPKPQFEILLGSITDCKGLIYIDKINVLNPYTVSWNNGSTSDTINISNGNWICTLKDKNGCVIEKSINLHILEPVLKIDTVNFENCKAKLTAIVTGGTKPYQYIWSNGKTSSSIDNLSNGDYTVSISDSNGCKSSISKNINIIPTKIKIELSNDNDSCSQKLFVSKNSAIDSILWNNLSTKDTIIASSSGVYTINYTDKFRCKGIDSVDLKINAPIIQFSIKQQDSCNTVLTWEISGGVSPYSIIWKDGNSSSTNSRIITPGESYYYQLTDQRGCSIKDSVIAGVKSETFILYNAISPNLDGINDVLHIKGIENFPINTVTIYNRYGHLIQEFKNYRNDTGWSGLWNNEAVPSGTYFYILELPCQGKIQTGYIEVR